MDTSQIKLGVGDGHREVSLEGPLPQVCTIEADNWNQINRSKASEIWRDGVPRNQVIMKIFL